MSAAPGARLAALYGACFAVFGVSIPFFPVWLEARGLSPDMIGVVLGVSILSRAAFAAPLMSLVDRGFGARRLFALCALGSAAVYAVLATTREGLVIAGLVALLAVAQAPLVPLGDWATTEAVRRDPRLHYGRVRLWGSITFLAANLASGVVIGTAGAGVIVWMLVGLSLASLAVVRIAPLPDAEPPAEAEPDAPPTPAWPRALWCVVAGAALLQASHAALYGFGSIAWRDRGFPEPAIGALWATGVLAEIALFAWLKPAAGDARGALRLMLLGGFAAVVRFGAMALEPGLPATFALQTLHGFSFGATHLGTMAACVELAPPGSRGRTQGVLGSALAITSAGASALSGAVFREAGAWAFAAMVPLAALGLILVAFALGGRAVQPQRAGEGG